VWQATPPAANPRLSLQSLPCQAVEAGTNRCRPAEWADLCVHARSRGLGTPRCPRYSVQLKPVTYACLLIDVVSGGISALQKVQTEPFQMRVTLHNRPRGNRRFVPNAAGWFPFCKNQPVSSAGRSKLIRGGVGRNLLNGGQIQRNTHSPPSPVPIPTRRRPVPVGCHRAGCLIDVDLGCGDWWGLGIACPGFPLLSQFQLQRRDLLLRLVGSQLGLAVFMLETLMLLSKPCQFSA
jgi:hypothetical protein